MMIFAMKLVLVLVLVIGTRAVFIEEPSSAVVAENDTAEFHCRFSGDVQSPGWAVGGEIVSPQNHPDFDTASEPASDSGPPVHTLSIVGRSVYNGTTVQCFSFSFSESANSSLATLQIQGLLAAVSELSATPLAGSILFSWAAPFSLNLTNTEPDITYCVDVLSSGGAGLVAGGCGLNETQYSFSADVRSPCDSYTAVVTPVNGAGNGSTASVNGFFYEAPMLNVVPATRYEFVNETQSRKLSVSIEEMVSVRVCTCELVFRSTDGIVPPLDIPIPFDGATCQKVLGGNGSFIFNTTSTLSADSSTAVVLNRIYSLEIMLSNSAGSYTTPPNRLSTHAVQDLLMMDSNSVTVLVVDFIENTVAPGCVVIITDKVVEYTFVGYLSDGNHTDTLTISGLSKDQHVIAAYDLDTSTRPGRYMAANESVDPNTERVSSSSGVEIEGAVKSEGKVTQPSADRMVCARCSDATATECLLLLHPVGNLTEIETLRVRNNQENCTRVRNRGDYIYSTFGVRGRDIIELSTNGAINGSNSLAVIVGATVSLVVIIITLVLVLLLLPLYCVRDRKKKHQKHSSLPVRMTKRNANNHIASLQSSDVESSITRLIVRTQDRLDSDSSTPTLHHTPPDLPPAFTGEVPDSTYDSTAKKHQLTSSPHLTVEIPDPTYDNVKPSKLHRTHCQHRVAVDSCSPTLPPTPPEQPAPDLPAPDLPAPDLPPPDLPAPEQPATDLPAPDLSAPDLPAPDLPPPDLPAPYLPPPVLSAPYLPPPVLPAPDLPAPDLPAPDLPPPFTGDVPDPTYDNVKPADKHAAAKGASTGSVYTTTKPNTKFQAPPAQDLSTNYDVVKGFKSQEGPQYAFPDVKTSTKAKPADQNIVAYETVTHTVPCTADAKKPEPASSLTAVGKPVAGPTKEQLYAKLLPVKKWKALAALAAQFKLNDNLIDEIYTNNERDEDCLKDTIGYWYQNGDFQHTWSEVVTALEAIGEHTLAEDIRAAQSIAKLPGTPEHSKPVFLPPTSRQSSHDHGRQHSSPLLTSCVPDNDAPPPSNEAVVGAVLVAYKPRVAHDTALPPNGVALFRGAYKPGASATLSQRLSTSLPGIDEDTYKSGSGAHFNKDGRRESYTDAGGSALTISSEPAVFKTTDDTDPNRKTGGAKIAEYLQPSVLNPTVASAEYSDHTDDLQYCQVMVEESKSAFCEKRDFLFDYEQVLHSRSALSKQPAFLQYNRKLQSMAASRGFDFLRETSEPDLVLNLPSQPESDEEEGKMTLDSSPALTLLSHSKEISVKLCGREDLKMAKDMKESAVINHFLDHLDASWRALVTALDGMKETEMVDRLRHYCEPPTGFGPSKEQDGQSDGRKDKLLDLHNFNPGHKSFAPSGEFDDHTFTIGCEKVFAWFSKTTFGPFDAHNFTPGFMQVIACAGIVGQL